MSDLLTTRQVQDFLKVDRITIYRMLQDGRLKGVKIGQQWRFDRREVDRLVGSRTTANEAVSLPNDPTFPTHCVQTVQDLFAEVSQVSALVIDRQGQPLTVVSRPSSFYQMLAQTTTGREASQASWRDFARAAIAGSKFFTCHSGLQYIAAPIRDQGEVIGLFLTGQFYWQAPDPREEAERVRRLSETHKLSYETLFGAARSIPVIDPAQQARIEAWPALASRAVESILTERTGFIERLQRIANLTQFT